MMSIEPEKTEIGRRYKLIPFLLTLSLNAKFLIFEQYHGGSIEYMYISHYRVSKCQIILVKFLSSLVPNNYVLKNSVVIAPAPNTEFALLHCFCLEPVMWTSEI